MSTPALISRDLEYTFGQTRMIGYFCAPDDGVTSRPGIVVIHDAFGLTEGMTRTAESYAALGFAVLAADVWGERTQPASGPEIEAHIGAMAGDRAEWNGRIAAALATLAALDEVDATRLGMVGYCFGGSSALEFVRQGGAVDAVVSIHGGLDLVSVDWVTPSDARVLICTEADDPMATPAMLTDLQKAMSSVDVRWEADVYSDTKHAFTNPLADLAGAPDVVGYNPLSARRSWDATGRFLADVFPDSTTELT